MAVLFSLSCSLNVSGSYPLPERFKSSYHCTWGLFFCNVSFGLQVKCVRIFYHQRSGVCTWKGRIIPVSRTIQPLIEHNPKIIAIAEIIPEPDRSEEHTSELQSRGHLVCRLLLEKKKK